jgi:hypothetical protein
MLPPKAKPVGGIKVSYRHSELLNGLGVESFVCHPADESFRCSWFEHNARLIKTSQLRPETDLLVIPELWASTTLKDLKRDGFKVCVFVQNCYYSSGPDMVEFEKVRSAYQAADLVTSISEDTSHYLMDILGVDASRIVRQVYSVRTDLFQPGKKEKKICYMPRKMQEHVARVVPVLQSLLGSNWRLVAIDGMNEDQVAKELSSAIMFLAFSGFEGLPVPPVEAALSGALVIGYHGEGGREYWTRPSFREVGVGDLQGFVLEVKEAVAEIESGQLEVDKINQTINTLSHFFSAKNELVLLKDFASRAQALFKI